jgi:hypothetical protein
VTITQAVLSSIAEDFDGFVWLLRAKIGILPQIKLTAPLHTFSNSLNITLLESMLCIISPVQQKRNKVLTSTLSNE